MNLMFISRDGRIFLMEWDEECPLHAHCSIRGALWGRDFSRQEPRFDDAEDQSVVLYEED